MKITGYFKKPVLMIAVITLAIIVNGCKKLIEVAPPINQIAQGETFKDSTGVQLNVAGMYARFLNNSSIYLSRASTLPGMSADELQYLGATYDAFINNGLLPDNSDVSNIWTTNYNIIYLANNIIANIGAASDISEKFRNQVFGEARFVRAMCYFYLVNYFGDVPLETTIDINTNAIAARTPVADVYNQIIADLQFAEANLPPAYTQYGNVRTRATVWAAKALLARVYLYSEQWQNAETEATSVINNTDLFSLPTDLSQVFTPASKEAIFQFYNDLSGYTDYASQVLPNAVSKVPVFYLTPQLVNAFEAGDARKTAWTSTATYNGKVYTYPYKYKSLTTGANAEYYTVLRLAEQYLVRAEARAHLNNINGAQADVNAIRTRAGLNPTAAGTPQELLTAIAQENRIEFNCEWGHRWFDLKRTDAVDAVIGATKPNTWKPTAALYPIPVSQIQLNNSLKPNPGY